MFFSIEFLIAARYLKAKKKEVFISVIGVLSLLGIMLGVMALIVVMSIMNGFRLELTSKLQGISSDITITRRGGIQNSHTILKNLKNLEVIEIAIPVIEDHALFINKQNRSIAVSVKGISNANKEHYKFLADKSFGKSKDGIIIGRSIAKAFGLKTGDKIELISPKLKMTDHGPVPSFSTFTIASVFHSGVSDYDATYIFMPISLAQEFFHLQNTVSRVEIFLNDQSQLDVAAQKIQDILGQSLSVQSWKDLNFSLLNALQTERVAMFMILAFIILVAAFNIISSLTMLVTDKTKEIAILRTLGFSRWQVMRVFLICGMLLGALGTALGVGAGMLLAKNIDAIKEFLSSTFNTELFDPVIYYLDFLPSHTDYNDVKNTVILSLVLCFLATLYPSYKAARLNPVDGLKND